MFSACSLILGMYWFSDASKPWTILLSPLAILFTGLFLLLASIVAIFGDSFADWAMKKIFKVPDPKNPFHQFLYFVLSAIGFVLVAIVSNIGDPNIRGYWHH